MFEEKINKLRELHNENSSIVDQELSGFVSQLEYKINSKKKTKINSLLTNIGITTKEDILLLIIIYIAIAIFGISQLLFTNPQYIFLFVFGMVFFIAGFQIGIFEEGKGLGLIFLFSHGGTGLGLVCVSLLADRFNYDLLTDLSGNMKIYIYLIIAILIIAVIGTVIYNLSDKLKINKYNKVILLLLFTAVIVLVGFLPIVKF